MFCTKCGSKIADESTTCSNCSHTVYPQFNVKKKTLIIIGVLFVSYFIFFSGNSRQLNLKQDLQPSFNSSQSSNIPAKGYELVCQGGVSKYQRNIIHVNCKDREEFINALQQAWLTLRLHNIGGTVEDLCWKAFNDAKDLHPSISFDNISDSFVARCNMGLEYVKD